MGEDGGSDTSAVGMDERRAYSMDMEGTRSKEQGGDVFSRTVEVLAAAPATFLHAPRKRNQGFYCRPSTRVRAEALLSPRSAHYGAHLATI